MKYLKKVKGGNNQMENKISNKPSEVDKKLAKVIAGDTEKAAYEFMKKNQGKRFVTY